MPTVADLVRDLDRIAPFDLAFSFDKVGLQVGDQSRPVSRVLVTLDRSRAAVARAVEIGANVIVAHHPLLFQPLGSVVETDHVGATVRELLRNDIALIGYHTNWDVADGGINDALASRLGLSEVTKFGSGPDRKWSLLRVYVPRTHVEPLCEAVWTAIGEGPGPYSRCSFRVEGIGTFRPLEGADPFDGTVGVDTRAEETLVEFTVRPSLIAKARRAAIEAHPYETPVLAVHDIDPLPMPAGRIGSWSACSPSETIARLRTLGSAVDLWPASDRIERVAVVGGAASGDWRTALAAGADLFVTGEVPQHVALEAQESGLSIAACGHYSTEQPGMESLAELLSGRSWTAELFVPEPGTAGRPVSESD